MAYLTDGYPEDMVVYVTARLVDKYATYLIAPVTIGDIRRSGETLCWTPSLEQAERTVRFFMDNDEKQSREAYNRGERSRPRRTRKPWSPFLRKVFGEDLKKLNYTGEVEWA